MTVLTIIRTVCCGSPGKRVDSMGQIYCILGKSAAGKDRMYRCLKEDSSLGLRGITPYTTRPRRKEETDGEEYHFIDEAQLEAFCREGKVIEVRTYQTVHGPWSYATVDDGEIHPEKQDYLVVGVLDSFLSLRDFFGADRVIPLYLEVEDGERLSRALLREKAQVEPHYEEMCRRFLADSEDFSEEKLAAAGIGQRYRNEDFETCLSELAAVIRAGHGESESGRI